MQNLFSHEHAKSTWLTMRVRVGEIKTVLVVETDLMLDENDKGYDRAALTEMLNALAEFLARNKHIDSADIERVRPAR